MKKICIGVRNAYRIEIMWRDRRLREKRGGFSSEEDIINDIIKKYKYNRRKSKIARKLRNWFPGGDISSDGERNTQAGNIPRWNGFWDVSWNIEKERNSRTGEVVINLLNKKINEFRYQWETIRGKRKQGMISEDEYTVEIL